MNAPAPGQNFYVARPAVDLWGRARKEPKFRSEEGGYIRNIKSPHIVLKMGPGGRWVKP
jgi:hypothetical protein